MQMKRLLPLILIALLLMPNSPAPAADVRFYLGTYTKPEKSRGIYVGSLDPATGALGPLKLAAETKNPSFLAASPDGKFVYAALEAGGGGAAGAFAVEPDGTLRELNSLPADDGACHIWVDATGRNVLVANYSAGSVLCFQTNPDGSLRERTAFIKLSGSGPDPKRQTHPYGHAVYTDPANRFVYVCDLGTDHVWIFKFDPERGTLTWNQPDSGVVPPGAGPRHLAFHPNGRFVYVTNEMGMSVTTFSRDADSGALTAIDTLPTLPKGTDPAGSSTAEIACHPSGRFLYVSNRGHDSIAVYRIAADGRLTSMQVAPAEVKVPRGFAIDPSGRWLVAGGQKDDRIAVLKIDGDSGQLSATGTEAAVGAPVCVLFAPIP